MKIYSLVLISLKVDYPFNEKFILSSSDFEEIKGVEFSLSQCIKEGYKVVIRHSFNEQ